MSACVILEDPAMAGDDRIFMGRIEMLSLRRGSFQHDTNTKNFHLINWLIKYLIENWKIEALKIPKYPSCFFRITFI